ncbi:MAG: BatD family protein [Bacteroidales bacterium]|nr:BatD family protein [Bacteroidales bacterium]
MKRVFTILLVACMAVSAWAQTSIRVEVHNIVELSERFNLVFVVEGENAPSSFDWECGEDFTLVWGPQKGSSTSISMVNGKTTRSSQVSYTYILQPKRTGSFTINPATAKVKGKEISSGAVSVKVVDNGSKQQSQQTAQSRQGSGQTAQSQGASEADIFMRLTLSRSSVVVGEPVTATLKIYHRANLVGFENAKFPTFKGFWSSEAEAPQNLDFKREEVNGTVYNAALIRRWVIIPQKAGDISIDPAEIVCLVNVQRRRSSGSIFDDFFGSDYATMRQRVYTSSPVLHVAALPEGAPASFGGGVGEFSVKAKVSRDSLKAHDAASLVVTVSGKGNIALLEAPKVNFPPDFEVYDMKSTTSGGATSGSKTFEYPFIPRSPGEFTIAPVKYSYYDVKSRRYKTAQTDSLYISVQRSSAQGSAAVQDGGNTLVVERSGVRNIDEDIRYIKTKTALGQRKSFFVDSVAYPVTAILMLLAALGFWLGLRKAAARRADVVGTRNRKAAKQALKRLSLAKDFLQKDLYTAFYEELHRSLLGYVGDKLSMDMSQLTKENISSELLAKAVPENVVSDFVTLLDECEYARYSPDSGHDAMNTHYEKAVSTITAIDSCMKKGPSYNKVAGAVALLLMLVPSAIHAQSLSYPDSLWKAGVEAYAAGNYASAVKDWEDVRATGLTSRELLYNLGNGYVKTGEIGKAVLSYERALRMDPSDADVKYNLEYTRSLTQDRIDSVPEFFLETWGRNACYSLPSDTWAVLSLVLLAVTLLLALLFMLGSSAGKRRLGFFGAIVAFIVTFVCWDFAGWQSREERRQDLAIVIKTVSQVGSSPSEESAKSLFILHEGTKVKILDNVSGFSQIEIADGRQGWIPSRDIEII